MTQNTTIVVLLLWGEHKNVRHVYAPRVLACVGQARLGGLWRSVCASLEAVSMRVTEVTRCSARSWMPNKDKEIYSKNIL